jgi:hypothetical protein
MKFLICTVFCILAWAFSASGDELCGTISLIPVSSSSDYLTDYFRIKPSLPNVCAFVLGETSEINDQLTQLGLQKKTVCAEGVFLDQDYHGCYTLRASELK